MGSMKQRATEQILVRITKAQRAALERIRIHDGITITNQVHRAIELWLAAHAAAPRPESLVSHG